MGAWSFIDPYLEWVLAHIDAKYQRVRYTGRPAAASPATGLMSKHLAQLQPSSKTRSASRRAGHGLFPLSCPAAAPFPSTRPCRECGDGASTPPIGAPRPRSGRAIAVGPSSIPQAPWQWRWWRWPTRPLPALADGDPVVQRASASPSRSPLCLHSFCGPDPLQTQRKGKDRTMATEIHVPTLGESVTEAPSASGSRRWATPSRPTSRWSNSKPTR